MKLRSLHEHWRFYHPKLKKWFPARVPGCIHLDLQNNNLIPDPFWGRNEKELQWIEHEDWCYQTEFHVSQKDLNREHVDLVANGLDTLAIISLNGKKVAFTE